MPRYRFEIGHPDDPLSKSQLESYVREVLDRTSIGERLPDPHHDRIRLAFARYYKAKP
jgi:hypothetical protein